MKYKYKGKINKSIKIICPKHNLQTTVDLFDELKRILGVGCRKCFENLKEIQSSFTKLNLT